MTNAGIWTSFITVLARLHNSVGARLVTVAGVCCRRL